jgi:hypothetical protein
VACLAALLEYIVAEVLEIGGNHARAGVRRAEAPPASRVLEVENIQGGIQADAELKKLDEDVDRTTGPIKLATVMCPGAQLGLRVQLDAALRSRKEQRRVLRAALGAAGVPADFTVARLDVAFARGVAQFHDAAKSVNPEYEHYVTSEMEEGMDARIAAYIREHQLQDGDILFVGSEYESRQEYGFAIVHSDGRYSGGEEVYGSGYRGILDMAREHGLDQLLDYEAALTAVQQFCRESGIGCDAR